MADETVKQIEAAHVKTPESDTTQQKQAAGQQAKPEQAEEQESDEKEPLPPRDGEMEAGDDVAKLDQLSGIRMVLDRSRIDRKAVAETMTVPEHLEELLQATSEDRRFLIPKSYSPSEETGYDKYFWMDVALMTTLAVVGLTIVAVEISKEEDASQVGLSASGSLLFEAGFTPLVLTAYAVVSGATKFRTHNYIKAGSSLFLGVLGLVLLAIAKDVDIAMLFGASAMEIGVLFFITKMFSIGEDDERTIVKLEAQLEEARRSVGAGMALSYFYNFVKPVVSDLYREKDSGQLIGPGDELVMMVKYGKDFKAKGEPLVLARHMMTILIPRDLNENNLRGQLRNVEKQAHVQHFTTFRPMFQPVLHTWTSDTDGRQYCSGLCDVPTIISSLWDRKKDVEKRKQDASLSQEEKDSILDVNVPWELIGFQNALVELVKQYPETENIVRIVSIPPAPIDFSSCWQAIAVADVYPDDIMTPRAQGEPEHAGDDDAGRTSTVAGNE